MIPFQSIRVGPFDVQIKQLTGEEAIKCLGMFDESRMAILMREQFPTEQQEAETFLHEILHAIFAIMNCKAKDPEERIISQMSVGLAGAMRDNGPLFDYLKLKLS